jgi:hypothetical protein
MNGAEYAAHKAVDNILIQLLQWNLAVEALERDLSKSNVVHTELLNWSERLIESSQAQADVYAQAERATLAAAAATIAVPPARSTPATTSAGQQRKPIQIPPSSHPSTQRSPSPAVAAHSRPIRPTEVSPISSSPVAAAPPPGWTPTPAAGASTSTIHSTHSLTGTLGARPGRRQYAEHATRPTLMSDEDHELAHNLNNINLSGVAASTAASSHDTDTAIWTGPLPSFLSSSKKNAVPATTDEDPSGLFGAPPRVNKAQMLSPYLNGTVSGAKASKQKEKVNAAASVRPAQGSISTTAKRINRPVSAETAPVSLTSPSPHSKSSSARRVSSGVNRDPIAATSANDGSAPSCSLQLESILRLAGRVRVADDAAGELASTHMTPSRRTYLPPPPPPTPAIPAPAPSSTRSSRPHANGVSSTPAPIPGPHPAYQFPPEFQRDIKQLKQVRSQIAALNQWMHNGGLNEIGWNDDVDMDTPLEDLPPPPLIDGAVLPPISSTYGERGRASIYPPPPFTPICSFPASVIDPIRPPFRYPIADSDLAEVKASMHAKRKQRAQANRQATSGLEPTDREVMAEAMRGLDEFERMKAQLFALQVETNLERGIRNALEPIFGNFDKLAESTDDTHTSITSTDSASPTSTSTSSGVDTQPPAISGLSTMDQLLLHKLAYTLLCVGGRNGPTNRFGRTRRAVPTFIRKSTIPTAIHYSTHWSESGEEQNAFHSQLPVCMSEHHLWRTSDEMEAARMAQNEEEFDEEISDASLPIDE